MTADKEFTLGHSMRPYAVILIVLCAVSLFWVYVAAETNQLSAWWWPLLALVVYISKIYFFDLRYSIFFKDESVVMRVATWFPTPKALTSIKISDITAIKRETSDLRTLATQRRVSQRIAIYDEQHKQFVDISLKHFVGGDIRKLLELIHERRPDLHIPTMPST